MPKDSSSNMAMTNERWSAPGGTNENDALGAFVSNSTTQTDRSKKSDSLRQMLCQDIGTTTLVLTKGPSSKARSLIRTMPIPSNNSLGSMSTISSTESLWLYGESQKLGSVTNISKNSLLRYGNMDSRNSLLSLNNRWRATPPNAVNSNPQKIFSSSFNAPISTGNQQSRWKATQGGDQPIGMVTRKTSATYLFPAKSA
ncbi:unnamed protein product [Pseudo-nitzschia multistriata]|uniref:Uncharacterized protein n=1 Tax=Pseudo-nitzschia multistriata TaxID=183589 RepID=A0A448ZPH8_9STRA|nr:unnamed protein product [Pseudo-nitzschia multistriata]